MDNLPNLEEAVAELFPNEYHPDRWLELLPQFITRHCELYDDRVKRYEEELEDWQQSAQLMPQPTYPVFPVVYALACEARAQYQGLSYRAVAVCLYTAQDRASFYEKKSDQLAALCHEYDEVSMTLRQHYLQLRRATVDKWPN